MRPVIQSDGGIWSWWDATAGGGCVGAVSWGVRGVPELNDDIEAGN